VVDDNEFNEQRPTVRAMILTGLFHISGRRMKRNNKPIHKQTLTIDTTSKQQNVGKSFEREAMLALMTVGFVLQSRSMAAGGDEGLDLVGSWKFPQDQQDGKNETNHNNKDETVLIAENVGVQCKHKINNAVGVETIRELESSIARWATVRNVDANKTLGVLCTNLRFSPVLKKWFKASSTNLCLVQVTNQRISQILFNTKAMVTFKVVNTTQWIPRHGTSRNVLVVGNRLLRM
jgi:hypothetical protein